VYTDSKIYLKVNLKQQLLVLFPFFLINALIIIGYILMLGFKPIEGAMLVFSIILFIINVLTVVLLHVQYLYFNYSMNIEINISSKELKICNKHRQHIYPFSNIQSLDYYATSGHSSKKGYNNFYTFDNYRFYKVKFKDGHTVFITCLTMYYIEKNLEPLLGVEANWHFRALPFIY
jgi:hypothetical protein